MFTENPRAFGGTGKGMPGRVNLNSKTMDEIKAEFPDNVEASRQYFLQFYDEDQVNWMMKVFEEK